MSSMMWRIGILIDFWQECKLKTEDMNALYPRNSTPGIYGPWESLAHVYQISYKNEFQGRTVSTRKKM